MPCRDETPLDVSEHYSSRGPLRSVSWVTFGSFRSLGAGRRGVLDGNRLKGKELGIVISIRRNSTPCRADGRHTTWLPGQISDPFQESNGIARQDVKRLETSAAWFLQRQMRQTSARRTVAVSQFALRKSLVLEAVGEGFERPPKSTRIPRRAAKALQNPVQSWPILTQSTRPWRPSSWSGRRCPRLPAEKSWRWSKAPAAREHVLTVEKHSRDMPTARRFALCPQILGQQ